MKKIWLSITAVGLFTSCQQVQGWLGENKTDSTATMRSETTHAGLLQRDVSITHENAYSDLFLDSAAVESFISRQKIDAEKAGRMRSFYLVRNNQFAWFNSDGVTEQGRGLWSLYESSGDAQKENNKDAVRLRDRMDSVLTNDSAFLALHSDVYADSTSEGVRDSSIRGSNAVLIETELALTAQYVTIAGENRGAITTDNYYLLVPRKKMDALQLADSLLHKEKDSSLWRGNAQYSALRENLEHYYEAAQSGGWLPLARLPVLRKGTSAPAVTQLKKRLSATGDYPANDTSGVYSDSLRTAIMAVQEQFGQRPTGQVTDSLLQELSVPAQERVEQILVNMNRALWLPQQASDSNRIVINIPTQELVVYGDSTQMKMPVIVGREGAGTMAFNDRISTVVFSPYWNLPESIVRNEVMPAMQKDPGYLKRRHMEIVRQNDSIPQVRQLPGEDNALGRVKFLFPNTFDIYLHDTPHKDLFAQKNRALSHGCIRVARPDSLAAFVLRGQPEWTDQKIAEAMNSGKEQKVQVKTPVPVSITYYTAWTAANGKLHFSRDIYGYDSKTSGRMFTGGATQAPAGRPA